MYEAVLNMGSYLDDNYISNGANHFYDRGTLPEQYAQYSDNYNPHQAFNMLRLYKREVLDRCKDFFHGDMANIPSGKCDQETHNLSPSKDWKSKC